MEIIKSSQADQEDSWGNVAGIKKRFWRYLPNWLYCNIRRSYFQGGVRILREEW